MRFSASSRSFSPMYNRRFMPSPRLPAPSLKAAYRLPAGRVLLLLSNYLICIVLRPIRGVVCGVESNFLPALREAGGRWSLEPGTIAVDMVGGAGEARAVAADDGHQRLVETAVVGVGGSEAIARRPHTVAQPCEIDRRDPPVVDHEAAAHHE